MYVFFLLPCETGILTMGSANGSSLTAKVSSIPTKFCADDSANVSVTGSANR
jgi:hypothetical protein